MKTSELIDTLERRLATAETLNHDLAEKLFAANKQLESYRRMVDENLASEGSQKGEEMFPYPVK